VNHLSDDELVLHYYGEDGPNIVAAERHLRACAQCARGYEALARSLDAVTPPEFVEAPDDIWVVRQIIRDRVGEQSHVASAFRRKGILGEETALIALVWLVPILYPVSLQALFGSARWAQEHDIGIPLVALTLLWACAGPLLAVFALNRMALDRFERASTRVLVAGALMAAISSSLFLLVSRVSVSLSLSVGLWSWYGIIALASLVALFRLPNPFRSTPRFLYVHRLSALVLTVFVLAHVINQALAFVSLPAYTAMRSVMRVASQQPVSYTVIVAAVAIQIATGAAMGLKRVRAGAVARNLQAVSGWCLAAFLLAHVFSALLFNPPPAAPTAAASFNQFDLLATARSTEQLPFLLLGVAAFLFHVGVYARLAALAYLAEASVRRLSYAGIFVGTTVVVTIGLSLCGVHLIR
jgi:succinate dehydrogenase/fumarate reductase cytochrome b subunit